MWQFILAALVAAPGLEIEVVPIDGDPMKGTLVNLSSDVVTIKLAEGDQMLSARDLLSVAPLYPFPSFSKPVVWVELLDGSRIPATEFTSRDRKATVELVGGQKVEVETRSIHSVLLKSQENQLELQKAWRKIQAEKTVGDILVVRKEISVVDDDDPTETARTEIVLNPADGVLHDVTAKTVEFEFGGDRIPVGRQKVEGLIYYHAANRKLPRPVCRVDDVDGGRWLVKSLSQSETGIDLTTVAGTKASLKFEQIKKFDFAAGNMDFLGDLEWEYLEVKRPLQFSKFSSVMDQQYHPRKNRVYGTQGEAKLQLLADGKKYEKGLSLRSNTSVVYQLPEGARRFIAKVGIDAQGNAASHVHLIIKGDAETLYEGPISGADKAPISLDEKVAGYRRLKIIVEPGKKPDHWDFLDLINARITR